jgi:hypothetical protein
MKTFSSLSALSVYLSLFVTKSVVKADLYDSFFERFYCPDPVEFIQENPEKNYTFECVDAAIPPWPMCLFHNVTYFIKAAKASASRCCDPMNMGECRCPFKYDQRFKDAMLEWCPKIDSCPDFDNIKDSELVTEAWSNMIIYNLEGIDPDEGDETEGEDYFEEEGDQFAGLTGDGGYEDYGDPDENEEEAEQFTGLTGDEGYEDSVDPEEDGEEDGEEEFAGLIGDAYDPDADGEEEDEEEEFAGLTGDTYGGGGDWVEEGDGDEQEEEFAGVTGDAYGGGGDWSEEGGEEEDEQEDQFAGVTGDAGLFDRPEDEQDPDEYPNQQFEEDQEDPYYP